jgi:hypothetical protein
VRGREVLLLRVLTHCMELSWLCAWVTYATAAITHRPFPLFEATLAFVGAFALTRLSTARGWLVLCVLGVQTGGLLCATAGIIHAFYYQASPLLNRAWLLEFLHAERTVIDWFVLTLNLFWALLFWAGGVTLARRPIEYSTACSRFDIGIAAFFALCLIRLTVAANGGAEVDDPVSHLFVFPFFVSSLVAIGMIRLRSDGRKIYLPGYRGIGVFLTFSAAALLFAATLTLFFLPYLTLAAQAGLYVMQGTAVALSPFLVWILRLLFAPHSLRPDPGSASTPESAWDALAFQQQGGWWTDLIEKILAWSAGILVALAGVAILGAAVFYLLRFLFSRTASLPGKREHRGSIWSRLAWLRRLWLLLSGIPERMRGYQRARDFYGALVAWARRSGHLHFPTETPSEFGSRLRRFFPPLKMEIALIVDAFNQESYGEVLLSGEQISEVRSAWCRLRSPRHWPARVKGRFYRY